MWRKTTQPNTCQGTTQRAKKRLNKAKTDNDETQKETKKKTNVTIDSQRQLINTNGIMELSRNQSSALAANKDSWGDKM